MRARTWGAWVAALLPVLAFGSTAAAQYPPPPQPYPPQPQPYPPQPQPYPPQPQPVPNGQPYPPQPYPPQPYPPQPYPQPLPAPYPQPAPVPQPVVPPASKFRSPGEMAFLAGTSIAYGVGTGIWIDSVASINDPAPAFILPVLFGAGVPIGLFVWDGFDEFHRGVPASIATGMLLGGLEGMAISGLQWQLSGGPNNFQNPGQWGFSTWTTLTFLTATGGAVGGYFFGEWLWPDPRSLALLSSGAGWGTLAGIEFGAGVGNDAASGAAVWGFAGYNAGMLAAGALSTFYTPSWQTLKYMWLGDLLGNLATTPVYLFYIGNSNDPRHGLIANAVGGLAGVGLAAALTYNMQDPPGTAEWKPPINLSVGPTLGGAQVSAYGQF